MNYGLIGCVGLKLPHKAKAKELYLSDLFKKSLAYCLKNYEKNFILSALYGVVDLEEEIEPYDLTLNTMPKQLIYVWSEKVFGQLIPNVLPVFQGSMSQEKLVEAGMVMPFIRISGSPLMPVQLLEPGLRRELLNMSQK